MNYNLNDILKENEKRLKILNADYNPVKGIGSPIKRFKLTIKNDNHVFLPEAMRRIVSVSKSLKQGSIYSYVKYLLKRSPFDGEVKKVIDLISKERLKYDFEFWAYTCIKIYDKKTLELIKFKLNRGQRKLLKYLEDQRLSGVPIRGVIDKARQWGGSTLVQFYMMWIQTYHKKNWHSAICAQGDDPAKNIREMYVRASEEYPEYVGTITLQPYAKSTKNLQCKEHGGIVGVGSVENPKQFRSYNFPMAHLSEVAYWGETAYKSAKKLAQGLKGTVPYVPYSVIIIESTPKGVGNYFHDECTAADSGKSGYFFCFVSWFENENNEVVIDDYEALVNEMLKNTNFIEEMEADYHWKLWELGATLENIAWYKWYMAFENRSPIEMFEEFPSTAEEGFVSSGRRVFPVKYINKARENCEPPEFIGEVFADSAKGKKALDNVRFESVVNGNLWIWNMPDLSIKVSNRYLLVVDLGGTTEKADHSIITVFDRYYMAHGGKMEVVAEWTGHLDHDLLAWKSAQIGLKYGKALDVIERNSLKKKDEEEQETDHSLTVIDEIADVYPNMYARNASDNVKEGVPLKYGFFTDRKTKPELVDSIKAALRDDTYVERDKRACDEMDYFEQKPDGSYGAVKGKRDDKVVTRGIGNLISNNFMDMPKEIIDTPRKRKSSVGMADI